jgi:small subunit ribosomal protein S9
MTDILEQKNTLKGIGKRKTAIANVLLVPGTGKIEINQKSHLDFFPLSGEEKELIKAPLILLEFHQKFDIFVKVTGGGLTSQIEAIKLGISKALSKVGVDEKQKLSQNSFLGRDSRIKERRKYGLRKARKAPQYSKR